MPVRDLIRDLRLALGWSQGRLADELCRAAAHTTVTRAEVSRWERGKRHPGHRWLRHLASVLDVPLQVLEGGDVRRREFIAGLAGTIVAPLAASELIQRGFAAALTNDLPSIDEWREKVVIYGRDYMALGACEIQQRLASDLVIIQQQVDDPALWAIAARLMTVYGKTIPGSDGAEAIQWYRMAAKAADRSDHTQSQVWVRGRAAIALGYEGQSLAVADGLADDVLALSEAPSLGRLNAVMGKAHVAAIRGDERTAIGLLQEGRRIFDVAGSHEQQSDYAVPEWRMAVFESLLHARLGQEHDALEAQDVALKSLPPALPRFATHVELHRGLMLARAGDRAGGAEYARTALDKLPPERHSLTLRMLLAEIEGRTAA